MALHFLLKMGSVKNLGSSLAHVSDANVK